ncbi:MAG: hypothetical protein ABIC95_06560 [archaeon]
MPHVYRKRTIKILFALKLTYAVIFFYALWKFSRGEAVIEVGLSADLINWVVMLLALLAIARAVIELHQVEHHHEMEDRLATPEEF